MHRSRKMQLEIWSDVVCPFCYIGKRKLEAALARLPQRDSIEITWRSFQLQPDVRTDPSRNAAQYLAEKKGWTLDYTLQALADVTSRARQVGLAFNYDQTVVANTFDAHRLAHYATTEGKGTELQEQLFRAYFVDGKNIADHAHLGEIAAAVGLPVERVRQVLTSGEFAAQVRADLDEAARLGIRAVPCFVFDRKYAVSGAQDSSVLLQALAHSHGEWARRTTSPAPQATASPTCDVDGDCA